MTGGGASNRVQDMNQANFVEKAVVYADYRTELEAYRTQDTLRFSFVGDVFRLSRLVSTTFET